MPDEMDEIWALYADDGAQALQAAEEALISLKARADDHPTIAALFRALHTFKGNSRLLGLSVVESRAHIAEDIVGLVRDEGVPLDPEMLELLFECTDALRGMMDDAVGSRMDAADAPTADIVARMKGKFERCRSNDAKALYGSRAEAADAGARTEIASGPAEAGPEVDPNAEADFAEIRDGADLPLRPARLGDDPLYFEIFIELAGQTLIDVEAALNMGSGADAEADRIAQAAATRLQESAERIELDEWASAARRIDDALVTSSGVAEALARLREMHAEGLRRLNAGHAQDAAPRSAASDPASNNPNGSFLSQISPLLSTLASVRGQVFHVTPELEEAAKELDREARAVGYESLAEAADQVSKACDGDSFDAALFDLYHALTLIGDDANPMLGWPGEEHSTLAPLVAWCEARSPDTLGKLALAINGRPARELDWVEIGVLLRNLWCICHAHRLDTACHVTSALQDLIARVRSGEMSPDPPLLRILFSFVEAGKPLLLRGRHRPGDVCAEAMLQRTSDAMRRFCGQDSGCLIGGLKLPASFVGMLSRDSIEEIRKALNEKRNFFVIRADTETYPEIVGAFVDWLSEAARSIASVTVFEDNCTRFDFLITTALDEASVVAALSAIDPKGAALAFQEAVAIGEDPASKAANPALKGNELPDEKLRRTPTSILESVGEIITAHATLRQILLRSLDDVGLGNIERLLRAREHRSEENAVALQAVQNWKASLEQLLTTEDQIATNLEHLQREFVASRLLCSTGMLSGLERAAAACAADEGVELSLDVSGNEEWVDADILDELDALAEPLVKLAFDEMMMRRLSGSPARWDLRIKLEKTDKRVSVCVESRFAGAAGKHEGYPVNDDWAQAARALRTRGGEFQRSGLPNAQGLRYVVSAPQSMAVLDGMIVRVGTISYVVPVQSVERILYVSADAMRKISADNGRSMLRIDHNTIAPIIRLRREFAENGGMVENLAQGGGAEEKALFIIANDEGRLAALPVDELVGQQPLLVRPLKGYLSAIPGVDACAPLGDGGVGMVISTAALFEPKRQAGLAGST